MPPVQHKDQHHTIKKTMINFFYIKPKLAKAETIKSTPARRTANFAMPVPTTRIPIPARMGRPAANIVIVGERPPAIKVAGNL